MDESQLSTWFTGITALAALVAAVGAWVSAKATEKAAKATERATEVTLRAALLGAVPLVVPWVDTPRGRLRIMNRGSSAAHGFKWSIIADGQERAHGELSDVIPPGRPRDLTEEQNAIVSSLRVANEVVLRCEYFSSWGESLKLERTERDGVSHIRLFDASGRVLRISNVSEPED